MGIREIITVGDPRLRRRSRDVREATPAVRAFIDDMVETMHLNNGVGLAAVQVGEMQNIIVVEAPLEEEVPGSGQLYVYINPDIVKSSRETEPGIEGCLSVPGYIGEVERAYEIVVRGLDRHGKQQRHRFKGYLARVFQHEIDHCKGVLYIDRLTAPENIWPVQEGQEEQAELAAARGIAFDDLDLKMPVLDSA